MKKTHTHTYICTHYTHEHWILSFFCIFCFVYSIYLPFHLSITIHHPFIFSAISMLRKTTKKSIQFTWSNDSDSNMKWNWSISLDFILFVCVNIRSFSFHSLSSFGLAEAFSWHVHKPKNYQILIFLVERDHNFTIQSITASLLLEYMNFLSIHYNFTCIHTYTLIHSQTHSHTCVVS